MLIKSNLLITYFSNSKSSGPNSRQNQPTVYQFLREPKRKLSCWLARPWNSPHWSIVHWRLWSKYRINFNFKLVSNHLSKVSYLIIFISWTFFSINFRLNDAYLEGLGQFEIKKFDIRFLRPSVSFDFFFKELVIEGQHTTRANLVIVPVSGNGPVKMIFNDFRIKGVFEMNTINGGYLNINQMIFSAQVGSVNATLRGFGAFLDGTISSLISNSLPGLINDGSDGINDLINESFLPLANEYLNQYRLIDVLLALIRWTKSFKIVKTVLCWFNV